MDKPSHWVTFLNDNFNPIVGFVHIVPKIGLKQPIIFLECTTPKILLGSDFGQNKIGTMENVNYFSLSLYKMGSIARTALSGGAIINCMLTKMRKGAK